MELIVPPGTHLSGERSDSAAVPDVMALPRMRQGEPELQASLGYMEPFLPFSSATPNLEETIK